MKKKRILFRADGNLVAGYGHVIRALSLAAILKKQYTCIFIIQHPDDFLRKQIVETCDEIIELPVSTDFKEEALLIAERILLPGDLFVIDGYDFNTQYQKQIKKGCFKLVCIDDLHTIHFVADAVINHSEGIKAENYSKETYTKIYLGTQYSILRRSFLQKNNSKTVPAFSNNAVFINMGGTDQQDYTGKALKNCLANMDAKIIDIVTGSFYPHKEKLEKIAAAHKNIRIRLHSNLTEKEMYALMKKSTIGICSASTISYEYGNVGGILFVYKTVPNQKNIYAFLMRSQTALPAGKMSSLMPELKKETKRKSYFTNRKKYFSGDSAQNLLGIFEKLETERGLTMRRAEKKDLLTYFKWANDPEVRSNAINTQPIPLESHTTWFLSKLKNKNAVLYILEKDNQPVGQVRFDRENKNAEIDYSIDEMHRGKGFGGILLRNALMKYSKLCPEDTITAKVKAANTASNKVFTSLGFKRAKALVQNKVRYENYTLKPR